MNEGSLAGVVFRDDADALERRLLGSSIDLSASRPISADPGLSETRSASLPD
jgi:hypothetical protein